MARTPGRQSAAAAWIAVILAACAADKKPATPDAAAADTAASDAFAAAEVGAETAGAADAKAETISDTVAEVAPDAAGSDAAADQTGDSGPDAACLPGTVTCENGSTVKACNSEGQFTSLPCGAAQLCLLGKCKVKLCVANAVTCAGDKIVKCDATGTGSSDVDDCAAQQKVCENGACAAKVCDPGTKHCNGNVAQICSPGGSAWLNVADCTAQNALCKPQGCVPIPCQDGGVGCEGDSVVQCLGIDWKTIKDCKADGQVCAGGKCQKTVCTAGDYDCVGGKYTICEPDGLSWSLPLFCPGGLQCAPGIGCLPPPAICQAEDTGCKGSQPVACDIAMNISPTGDDCAKTGKACSGGACKPKLCAPGQLGCTDNHAVACSDAGTDWLDIEDCGKKVCSKGVCQPKVCGQGQTACAGAKLALCQDSWQATDCPNAGEVCGQGQCVVPQCKPEAPEGTVLIVAALPLANIASACDLNDDKKPDQALGVLSQMVQGGISAQAVLGKVRVLQLGNAPDNPFATLLPASVTPTGDFAKCAGAGCSVYVEPDGYELLANVPMCPARTLLGDVVMDAASGKYKAGGGAYTAFVPLQAGVLAVELPLFGAQLKGKVLQKDGAVVGFDGVLCGAVPQDVLFTILSQIPDAAFGGKPEDKVKFAKLLTTLAAPDLDLDGDGKKESVSAAFAVVAVPGKSLGLAK